MSLFLVTIRIRSMVPLTLLFTAFVFLLAANTNCATITTIADYESDQGENLIYSGTAHNIMSISFYNDSSGNFITIGHRDESRYWLAILDSPFSCILDTLLLPFTIPHSFTVEEPDPDAGRK